MDEGTRGKGEVAEELGGGLPREAGREDREPAPEVPAEERALVTQDARHRGALTLGTRVRFPLAQHTRRGSPPHGIPEIVK